jgi:hypothetical protein
VTLPKRNLTLRQIAGLCRRRRRDKNMRKARIERAALKAFYSAPHFKDAADATHTMMRAYVRFARNANRQMIRLRLGVLS